MKTITEYLSAKPTNLDYIGDKFPKKPNYDEIINYALRHGFKIAEYNHKGYLADVLNFCVNKAEHSNTGIILTTDEKFLDESDRENTWIRLFKCGTISKDNPILLLRICKNDENHLPTYKDLGIGTIETEELENRQKIDTFEEFRENIYKYMGWEI